MNFLLSTDQTQQHLSDQDFIRKTMAQIQKDFSTVGMDLPFSNVSVDGILKSIQWALETLMKEQPSSLQQLLYQIDLPESLYTELLGEETFNEQLSELILRREAYKIFLRKQFQ